MKDGTMPFVLTLCWRCTNCGWACIVDTPGFAGDGFHHFPDGDTPCGPLVATRTFDATPRKILPSLETV